MEFRRIKRWITFGVVNWLCVGLGECNNKIKRIFLNWYGYYIEKGVRFAGKIQIDGKIKIGQDTFIGKNFRQYGNGLVTIGNNCDIAPDVVMLTGSHDFGDCYRRAGKGWNKNIYIGDGTWIGARSTILPNVTIGTGCVIAACTVVTKDIPDNVLVAGVPAKILRNLK